MPTLTPELEFKLPTIGADDDLWGGFLNENFSALDALISDLQNALNDAIVAAQIPVDGLYFSASDTDPAATLGYGTWVEYAAGRALVGVGNNSETSWAAGDERGSETHTLTTAQLASHGHGISDPGHAHGVSDPGHVHGSGIGGNFFINLAGGSPGWQGGGTFTNAVQLAGATDRRATGISVVGAATGVSVQTSGSGDAHNNVQPSLAVYVWKRLT